VALARDPGTAGEGVVVATFNVHNTADRWRDRAPLVVEQLVDLAPDVIGLQEVRRFPGQARWIARHAGGWTVRTAYKSGPKRLWEGLAVLSRLPVVGHGRLRLGGESRVALRVTVSVPGGQEFDVYDTHLADSDPEVRCAQVRRLLTWMDERPDVAQVVVGDLNSRPGSAPLKVLTDGGRLRSAYAEVHGSEPARTVPGGTVIDYIFVNDRVTAVAAWLAFDRPAPSPEDPKLFPSDHLGVAARLIVR
jgi:endonuclease/exonuclease/phosphatase family metal-dependent hydrolase